MSVELISVLIAVLAVEATLGGLILTGNRGLRQDIRQDMAQLETRLDGRIGALARNGRANRDITAFEGSVFNDISASAAAEK